jgi:hypothetical protein
MSRLIDADKLQDYFWDNRSKLFQAKDCRIAIDNAPTVEAIPKDQYETRLKADMVAMLTEIQLEIEELDPSGDEWRDSLDACNDIIQQKINALGGKTDVSNENIVD